MLRNIILVAAGGAVGSALRFILSWAVDRYWHQAFPLATFIVNILGCFAIGVLITKLEQYQVHATLRPLLITGLCGGFTTFSAFSAENLALLQQHQPIMLIAYITASVILGVLAVWAGMQLC